MSETFDVLCLMRYTLCQRHVKRFPSSSAQTSEDSIESGQAHSIEQGRQGAIKVGSERRWQEAYASYHQGKGVWPHEAAVKNLAKQFVR